VRPGLVTTSQLGSFPPAGAGTAIQVASKSGVSPWDAGSSRAKLSLIENGRDGSWPAVTSAAVASGLRVIAFG
jgi:hypothetical protein